MYILTHKQTNEFYIGYREANKVPSNQDIVKIYASSSKHVKDRGIENFEPFILAEFFDPLSAYEFENRLIKDNIKNPLCLNRRYVDVDTGKLRLRRPKKGEVGYIQIKISEETRHKLGMINKGKPKTDECKLKLSEAGKLRVVSDETKEKISAALKGKSRPQFSETWISNMSKAQKARKHNPTTDETKQKLRNAALNRSSETKERLRLAAIEMWKRRKSMMKPDSVD